MGFMHSGNASARQRRLVGICLLGIASASHHPADTQHDGTLYCVGSKGSGKSTIIDRFLGKSVRNAGRSSSTRSVMVFVQPQADEPAKPTESPQYTYARLPADGATARSRVGHIWEIAGPTPLVTRFTADATLFLPPSRPSVVVVAVDIADPARAVGDAQEWLRLVTQRAGSAAAPDAVGRCRGHWDPQHPDLVAGHIHLTGMVVLVDLLNDGKKTHRDPAAARRHKA